MKFNPIQILLLLCFAPSQSFAASREAPAVTRPNVMVVLDASGSMNERMPGSRESKMAVATDALVKVLGTVPPGTDVGVIVFSGSGKPGGRDLVLPLGPLDPGKLAALSATLANIRGNGGTPLDTYLKQGADLLLAAREGQLGYGTYRLLVVTDGEADRPKLVDAIVPDVLSRGVGIDVVGVAMNDRITLAERANSYRTAGDEAALMRAVGQTFAEVSAGAGDEAGADFGLVAALPDDAAAPLIDAMTRQKSGKVGDAPLPPIDSAAAGVSGAATNAPAGGAAAQSTGGGMLSTLLFACVGLPGLLIVALFVIVTIARSKTRG